MKGRDKKMSLLDRLMGRTPRTRKTVKLLRPLDYRGEDFPVKLETEKGFHCKVAGGVEKLFIKWGPSWTFPNEIVAFGVEGTPLTAHPTLENVKIPISDWLREAWGKHEDGSGDYIYDRLTDRMRNIVETDMGIICGIKATMPDENMDISSLEIDSILREADAAQMREFGKSTPKKNALRDNLTMIIAMALSFFVGMLAEMKGWI